MIATPHFVFLHVPKTGGSFVCSLLRQHCEVTEFGDHACVTSLPSELTDLPKFVLVRNPWAWYVSYYQFMMRIRDGNPLFEGLTEGGTLGFEETVRRACGEGPDIPYVPRVVSEGMPLYQWWWNEVVADWPTVDPVEAGSAQLREPAIGRTASTAVREAGPASHTMTRAPIEVGKQESLRQDLVAFLDRYDVPGKQLRKAVLEAAPANEGSVRDYRGLYTPELRELVREKHPMMLMYGYEF